MRFGPAIVIALAAACLAPAVVHSYIYFRDNVRKQILDKFEGGADLAEKFTAKYEKLSEQEGISELDSGKYALAAKLMDSIVSIRWSGIMRASDEDLKGSDYDRELKKFQLHVGSFDSQIDGRLESLIKLAGELPANNGIASDVKAIIKDINDTWNWLADYRKEKTGFKKQQA